MREMMRKPIVGETLFSLNVGNAARNVPQELTPVTVEKVGRKYFTVRAGRFEKKFELEDWSEHSKYSPVAVLYESEQEWEDEKEKMAICQLVADSFKYGGNSKNLSLSDLRIIRNILE